MRSTLLLIIALLVSACGSTVETTFTTVGQTMYFTQAGTNEQTGDYIEIPVTALAIDYRVSGSCAFGVRLFAEATPDDNVDAPGLTATGPDVAGTWHVTIKPGRYAVAAGGDGCTWSITVRDEL
ncbi:MAG: hypothetical protein ABI864_00770 [Chloroflexota bacterium]